MTEAATEIDTWLDTLDTDQLRTELRRAVSAVGAVVKSCDAAVKVLSHEADGYMKAHGLTLAHDQALTHMACGLARAESIIAHIKNVAISHAVWEEPRGEQAPTLPEGE